MDAGSRRRIVSRFNVPSDPVVTNGSDSCLSMGSSVLRCSARAVKRLETAWPRITLVGSALMGERVWVLLPR